jgi:signal peptidase I
MGQDRQPPAGDDSEASERQPPPGEFTPPVTAAVRSHAPFTPETTPPLIGQPAPSEGPKAEDAWVPPQPPPTTLVPESAPSSLDRGSVPADEPTADTFDTEPTPAELAIEVERQEQLRRRRTRTIVRELTETGLLALIVFLGVRASLQNFKVDGSSMFPTLHNGQFLIVNKLVYTEIDTKTLGKFLPFVDSGTSSKRSMFHGPQRGDIVVLVDPQRSTTDLVKRIIGLPGDSLEIVDGKVYINGQLLIEPYIKTAWHDTKPKVEIPAGEYFVMGDNRDNSLDSRSSQVGLIPADHIIGKALLSYWPADQFGLAPNEAPSLSAQNAVP